MTEADDSNAERHSENPAPKGSRVIGGVFRREGAPDLHPWITFAAGVITVVSLCVGGWPWLIGSQSKSISTLVPFFLALALYIGLRTWSLPHISASVGVGCVLIFAGSAFLYLAIQPSNDNQKCDYEAIGASLLSLGIGILVGPPLSEVNKK